MASDSQSASAASIWWVENTIVRPASRSSTKASRSSVEVDRVEPGERLVHEQDVRAVEDGRDELDLLLVALAELLGAAIGVIGDAEARQPVAGLGRARSVGMPYSDAK